MTLALTLGMGLGAIFQDQLRLRSVEIYLLKSMNSFQSISADADTWCEQTLSNQFLFGDNNKQKYQVVKVSPGGSSRSLSRSLSRPLSRPLSRSLSRPLFRPLSCSLSHPLFCPLCHRCQVVETLKPSIIC